MKGESTELMTTIADCGVCNSLKELYCTEATLVNETHTLAKILANAPVLKKIYISNQLHHGTLENKSYF